MKKLNILVAIGATFFGTVALAQCDLTNLDAWTSNNNPDGKLTVTLGSAMAGTTCGLAIETFAQPGGQATKHFVQDSSPVDEVRYRGAFCIDINSVPLNTAGANRRLKVHNVQCTTGGGGCANTDILQFKIENDATDGYRLDMFVRDSNQGNTKNRNFILLPDAPTRVEYDMDLAAGTFKLWLNATAESDVPELDLTGLDQAAWTGVDRARLGSQDKSGNVPVGNTFFIDEFESRRQTFIGGACN